MRRMFREEAWRLTGVLRRLTFAMCFTSAEGYELPFGKGKQFLANSRLKNAVFGGYSAELPCDIAGWSANYDRVPNRYHHRYDLRLVSCRRAGSQRLVFS